MLERSTVALVDHLSWTTRRQPASAPLFLSMQSFFAICQYSDALATFDPLECTIQTRARAEADANSYRFDQFARASSSRFAASTRTSVR